MASDSWFRFYNTAPDSPKVLLLTDAQFRAWVILLCLASKLGGTIPDSVGLIAVTLRKTAQKSADTIQVLLSAGLLDKIDGGYEPHNWAQRQFKSDVSTSRVQKYRAERTALGLPILSDYSQFRPALIARDGATCVYCLETENLVVDHITPTSLGGTDDPRNLGLACRSCNSLKGRKTPEQAKMIIRVTSCAEAYTEYAVTVTGTPQRQKQRQRQKIESNARMARFEEFWNSCPKKTGKGVAEKAWLKALDLADADTLIAAIRGYANTCTNKENAFIKTPGPWLNGKHWLDEGIAPGGAPLTPDQIEANRDRADQIFRRGKYAEVPN